MKPLDKNYLSLQFWNKVHTKNGTEFQSFFEDIMQKAFPDFQKIRPYGNEGDGGNDGYIKNLGIYYQVYAPNEPAIKEAIAAKKLSEDFEKLKKNWSNISEIKKYYFVYNDKNNGSTQKLESVITKLQKANANIEFEVFNPKKLEETFFLLSDADILNLGFNISSTIAIDNAYEYMKKIEIALDNEYIDYAFKLYSEMENIINKLKDEQLEYEYELIKCKCLQKLEKVTEAKSLYQSLSIRYPQDPRAILYLAEIYLSEKNYRQNQLLLDKVENNHWLYQIEVLLRKITLDEKIESKLIDEHLFPEDSKIRSNYYLLYSLILDKNGDSINAESFIEKAIHLFPGKFIYYLVKLSIVEGRLYSALDTNSISQTDLNEYFNYLEEVENKYFCFNDIRPRSQATLLLMKLRAYRIQKNLIDFEKLAKEIFRLILKCYFDSYSESMLVSLLWGIYLPIDDFKKLISYLEQTQMNISVQLSELLIIQFSLHGILFSEGKKYFDKYDDKKYSDFICGIEKHDFLVVIDFLKADFQFAIALTASLKDLPELRKQIIDNIPNDMLQTKEKLLLLYYFDINDIDNAFKILKNIDILNLNYIECRTVIQIVQKKEAWDLEIIIINKLLEYERDDKIRIDLRVRLFQSYYNLKDYLSVIQFGTKLIEEQVTERLLDSQSMEYILAQTIQAYLWRGEENNALIFLNKYNMLAISAEFKVSVETNVYLKNNLPIDALNALVLGVKIKKQLTQEEYATLFYLVVQIENLINIDLQSIEEIHPDCFVKLINQDRWYYIGDDNELDSTKINSKNEKYLLFIGKKIGDEIIFSNKYSSKNYVEKIELIFTIDKYIFWQSANNFDKLSREGRWASAKRIEVPPQDDSIDTKYLETFFKDEQATRYPLFNMYCEKNIPLAMLALNEGSLPGAISRIIQENKGFIKFSSGVLDEMELQKKIANVVVNNKSPFVIDGTSALFLSETGLLKNIHDFIPNIKVPQSVITMLLEVADKIRFIPGAGGRIGYSQGQITYSSFDKEKCDNLRNNLYSSIEILESNRDNILSISHANKLNCISESDIFPELCDACIFAQKLNIPVLTEDYYYLQMNEIETKKKAPAYFSSIILFRVLYEHNKIKFDDYLKYFCYLSSYRGRFLSFNVDDIYKAVFGDENIISIRPEYIRQLNFPLTLSQEYGVPYQSALSVLAMFLYRLIIDDAILVDNVELIYLELLNSLPKDKCNKEFAILIINICVNIINTGNKIILSKSVQIKVDKLFELTKIFNFGKNRSYLI
jgi:hypothetical protein